MPGILSKNILIVGKKESVFGTPAGASGGTIVRLNPSPGLSLKRAVIQSNEFRKDGQRMLGRLGGKSVDGSYEVDLVVGGVDFLIDGLMRAASMAALVSQAADYTTTTITGGNTVTWASGNPLTKGLRVGDIIRPVGTANANNNNKNFRIIAVTANSFTVGGTAPLSNQGADATGTWTRGKKWINGATPVRASYTFEEYLQDGDDGFQLTGVRVVSGSFGFDADAIVKLMMGFLGQGASVLGTAAAPYFTTPTMPPGNGLVATDGLVRVNGQDVTYMSSLKTDFNLGGQVKSVIGSLVSPDVYENDLAISGQLTGLQQDMAEANLFIAETPFEIHVLLEANMPAPKDYISLFLPRCAYSGMSGPIGADGPRIISLPFMTGIKDVTTGYDATSAVIVTSAT